MKNLFHQKKEKEEAERDESRDDEIEEEIFVKRKKNLVKFSWRIVTLLLLATLLSNGSTRPSQTMCINRNLCSLERL